MKLDFRLQRPRVTVSLLPLKPFTGHRATNDLETGMLRNRVENFTEITFYYSLARVGKNLDCMNTIEPKQRPRRPRRMIS